MDGTGLVLSDGSRITLDAGSGMGAMKAHYPDRAAMLGDWQKLTEKGLETVKVMDGDTDVGMYSGLVLESETFRVNRDGSVDTEWHIREKTDHERLEERIAKLEEGQEVQDGAIGDLGEVTSVIAAQLDGKTEGGTE